MSVSFEVDTPKTTFHSARGTGVTQKENDGKQVSSDTWNDRSDECSTNNGCNSLSSIRSCSPTSGNYNIFVQLLARMAIT